MNREKLLPQEILDRLPPLGATSKQENPMIQVKFFYPDSNWTWYAIEFDGEDIFYGFVTGFENELGNFSLRELMENRGKMGLEIERDFHFYPMSLNDLKETLYKG